MGGTAVASASVTVDPWADASDAQIHIYGTATCSAPTGVGELTIFVTQVFDFAWGTSGTSVDCANGTSSWSAVVPAGIGSFRSFHSVTVTVYLTRNGIVGATCQCNAST